MKIEAFFYQLRSDKGLMTPISLKFTQMIKKGKTGEQEFLNA